MSHIEHPDAQGQPLRLTGRSQPLDNAAAIGKWTAQRHPDYHIWQEDEQRWRASFIATNRVLRPFLVPHRSEETKERQKVPRRARYGYGIGLNKAYLGDIFGNIQRTTTTRSWSTLGKAEDQSITDDPSEGTIAATLWEDATLDGTSWRQFWDGDVLEWILTSPGALVLVDMPQGEHATMKEAMAAGKRPTLTLIPLSWMLDCGRDKTGFRWIKLLEEVDERVPNPEAAGKSSAENKLTQRVAVWELLATGFTQVSRYTMEGEKIGDPVLLQRYENPQGRAILPLFLMRFGTHEEVTWLGSSMLSGLADIVIDLYNLVSEMREAYREDVWAPLAYRGDQYEDVRELLGENSRLINLGASPDAAMDRVQPDATGVTTGIEQIQLAMSAWSLGARRKSADAVVQSAEARSGVALQAEFELDLKPVLVTIARVLDAGEEQAMFLAAQMVGIPLQQAFEVEVDRSQDFRLEEEASRISRIVKEFTESLELPNEAKIQITMAWLEHSSIAGLDMDGPAFADDPNGPTMREMLEEELRTQFESAAAEQAARSEAFNKSIEQQPPPKPGTAPPVEDVPDFSN